MEKKVSNEKLELEVGIRFNPSDVELLSQFLTKKVADSNFSATSIVEVDMNNMEPWDLPGLAKMGETEWYFFSLRVKKYPTSPRTNRATVLGYWKATGKDKQIIEAHVLFGMKKTLVFYTGRAPQGIKTNWVMHEYRLEDNKYNLSNSGKGEWVICRVSKKRNRGKKVEIPKFGPSPVASLLPPLMETSSYTCDLSQVTCFSDLIIAPNQEAVEDNNIVDSKETPMWNFSSFDVPSLANETPPLVFNQPPPQVAQQIGNSHHGDFFQPHEHSMWRMLMDNDRSSVMINQKLDFSPGIDYDAAAHISPVVNNNDMPHEQSMLRMLMENDGSSVMVNRKVDFSPGIDYDVTAHISPVVNNNDMPHEQSMLRMLRENDGSSANGESEGGFFS